MPVIDPVMVCPAAGSAHSSSPIKIEAGAYQTRFTDYLLN
jgi:hypothetical protein